MTHFIDKCILCGSSNLKAKTGSIEVPLTGQKKSLKSPRIKYVECQQCGERYTDAENESKIAVGKTSERLFRHSSCPG